MCKLRKEIFMEILRIFTNQYLLVPVFSWLIAQVLKTVINAIVNKEFEVSRLVGDGGMPSGHSATVTALACTCGFSCGFNSVEFAIAGILAVIVMHDAMGVRRETGKQAKTIFAIVEVINEYVTEKDRALKAGKLKVMVGHTPLQVACGCVIGMIVCIVYILIGNIPAA